MAEKNYKILIIAHYFPPINSSGARRIEVLSDYLVKQGFEVTVVTTKKISGIHGEFTEKYPDGVKVLTLSSFGGLCSSVETGGSHEPMYLSKPSFKRRFKNFIMRVGGQIPDPRLPFALSFFSPFINKTVVREINLTDIILATAPPWPTLLAATLIKLRFKRPVILDYRDHFSECHEMPGGKVAKIIEKFLDRFLCRFADAIVVISEPMRKYYQTLSGKEIHVVMNGYDSERMDLAKMKTHISGPRHEKLTCRYMGIMSPGRIPKHMIAALSELYPQNRNIKNDIVFEYYGHNDILKNYLEEHYPHLLRLFSFYGPVSYDRSLELIAGANFALFSETSEQGSLSAQGILTTKLFEYLGAGVVVLADIDKSTLAGATILKASDKHIVCNSKSEFIEVFLNNDFWTPRKVERSEFVDTLSRQYQSSLYKQVIEQTLSRGSAES